MDRGFVYPGQIPLDTDLLNAQRFALIGLGHALHDIIGSTTVVGGASCVPTAPGSMNVSINPGRIYSVQPIDSTAYGSLAADTAHNIVKQGILVNATTLSTPAPVSAGTSIAYLIEAQYADVDNGLTVLPYFNVANPTQTYSGPNNSGTPQATVRNGQMVLQIKAGVAATTGTQVTPTPDVGWTGLYVVTVPFGLGSVVAGNIANYSGALFLTAGGIGGLATVAMTGLTTAPTALIRFSVSGGIASIRFLNSNTPLQGTSNGTPGCTITGFPTILTPSGPYVADFSFSFPVYDNSVATTGILTLVASPPTFELILTPTGNPTLAMSGSGVTGLAGYPCFSYPI